MLDCAASLVVSSEMHESDPIHPDEVAFWAREGGYDSVKHILGYFLCGDEHLFLTGIKSEEVSERGKTMLLSLPASLVKVVKRDAGMQFPPPTALDFLGVYANEAGVGKRALYLAQFYCERALSSAAMLRFKPSQNAATALMLAMAVTKEESRIVWGASLATFTGYHIDNLRDCVVQM